MSGIIPAKEWRKLRTSEILESIDIALKVLEDKKFISIDILHGLHLILDFVRIIAEKYCVD